MRPSYIWLITDTHWNSEEAFKERRPQNYGWKIISNCSRVIAKQDTLIHLGDVIDRNLGDLQNYLSLIPGKTKILIRGNHDKQSDNWYMNKGFDFVCDSLVLKQVILSHIPIKDFSSGVKYNIHGHFHNNPLERVKEVEPHIYEFYNKEKYILVAMENTDYKPVNLDELIKGVL